MLPHFVRRLPSPPTRRAAAVVAGGALFAAACGNDPLEAAARFNVDNIEAVFVVFPFSTAAAPLNTAISVSTLSPVRPGVVTAQIAGGTQLVPNFEFVVDRAPDGRTRLVPSKLLAGLEGTGRFVLRTGIQVVSTPFDSLAAAPDRGTYQRDSVTVVSAGQTFVVESESPTCVAGARTFSYSKFVVDSVSPTSGGTYMRALINLNCGFRSLRPGRPTS